MSSNMNSLEDLLKLAPTPAESSQSESGSSNGDMNLRRRRTEDIKYWRQRAGWYDDDVSMKDFNKGVYDKYYETDDTVRANNGDGSGSKVAGLMGQSKSFGTFLKVGAVVIACLLAVVLYRALMRKPSKKSSRSKSSGDGKSSRSRSKSASRSRSSRSRSRSRRAGASSSSSKYELMDDGRSRKSSRSRSRSRKARSARSRSKSRPTPVTKEVLV